MSPSKYGGGDSMAVNDIVETKPKPHFGAQSIYAADGMQVFSGMWNPKTMFELLTPDPSFWKGKTVLEIAANTGGLSVEMARAGAVVTMTEPDPYKNNLALSRSILDGLIRDEGLQITIQQRDFFQCRELPKHDVIVCLGLLYHFRHPQLMLDMLSAMNPTWLFVSTQTHPADELAMFNRMSAGIMRQDFYDNTELALSGWHPTRALFARMLEASGFGDIQSLTSEDFPKVAKGVTNSAYFRARLIRSVDVDTEMMRYYPR